MPARNKLLVSLGLLLSVSLLIGLSRCSRFEASAAQPSESPLGSDEGMEPGIDPAHVGGSHRLSRATFEDARRRGSSEPEHELESRFDELLSGAQAPGGAPAQPSSDDGAPVFGDLALRAELEGDTIVEYYDNGQIWYEGQQEFQQGEWRRQGAWLAYWDNGQVHEDGRYEKGREAGLWKWSQPDGSPLAHGRFLEGKREGPWVFYHENGRVMMEGSYSRGLGSGSWVCYHENGSRRAEGRYEDGEPSGEWLVWREDGSLDEDLSGPR